MGSENSTEFGIGICDIWVLEFYIRAGLLTTREV